MRRSIWTIAAVSIGAAMAGCGADEVSPFVGSWTQTQPSGATFLWVIEEAEDGYAAWVYTDQAEWCDGEPYWSQHQPTLIDEVTIEFTGVTNQCYGGERFSNSFYSGQLIYDPVTDTMRDAEDPEDWRYQRDTSVEPGDLYPDAESPAAG
jgi:hypothetical protein